MLQRELLEVIRKYVQIDEKKVEVSFERGGDYSTLEVNIELPPPSPEKSVRARGAGDAALNDKSRYGGEASLRRLRLRHCRVRRPGKSGRL